MIPRLICAVPLVRRGYNEARHLIGLTNCLTAPLSCSFHTTTICNKYNPVQGSPQGPVHWPNNNDIVYPPQQPGEPRRPAWVCHYRSNIKYSPLKLWYIACLIRGMSIDEALKQIDFVVAKGAGVIKEVLLEAQELAVKEHNVEYKSNLWVAESFVGEGVYVQGYRRHARARFGIIQYKYSHYFVRLEEGKPPKHYYKPKLTGNEQLKAYLDKWRSRKITLSL